MTTAALTIRKLVREDLPVFFMYLNDHLRDNGSGTTALFMPMPRSESVFTPEKQASFRTGMDTPVGLLGWRRGWIALTPDGSIAGHVDLRARPEKTCVHRALLGMGVHRDYRQQGLGKALLEVAMAWAATQQFDWVDIDVLSANAAARKLYERDGFTLVGEFPDMFRIDGDSVGHTMMTKKIH